MQHDYAAEKTSLLYRPMHHKHVAEKILKTQLNLVRKNPELKDDILKSHQKLVTSFYFYYTTASVQVCDH